MPNLTTSADIDAFMAAANDAAARTELGLGALATVVPGTGIATALAINVGSVGAPVLFNGALGTPSSGVATNLTGTAAGLTAGTASAVAVGGITGAGTGVLTFLATPSSANLAAAVTGETGSGALVFGTSPAFTTNFTLANGASPTTSAVAQMAFDTDAWAASRGAVAVNDGTATTWLVGVLASDTPSNGQVPTWNTGGTITWETPGGAANAITAASAAGSSGLLWVSAGADRSATATNTVGTLNATNLNPTNLTFAGTASPSYAQGKLVYDTDNESLTFFNNEADVGLQIGQELWTRVRNSTGSTIANGAAVYVSGNHAGTGLPEVSLADADSATTTPCIGLATHAIENNTTGFVTTAGVVHGLNTSGFSNGAVLYLSSTAGALTSTPPVPPALKMRIGVVTKSNASTGTITVILGQRDAGMGTKVTATNYTVGTTDPNELYGGVIYVTAAATITVPAVAVGASFTVVTVGAVAVSVDPNAADLIYLDGVALSDGDKITNLSTAGDIAVFTYYDSTGWYAATNGWTDTN